MAKGALIGDFKESNYPRQEKKKVVTPRKGTPPQCPITQPLPQTTEVFSSQPPEVVPSQPPEVALWETKIIPGILPIPSEKESSDYVSVSGGTSTTTLDEPHLPPERSPVKKKKRTYSSRDPAFQPRMALRDSPGIVGLRTRSKVTTAGKTFFITPSISISLLFLKRLFYTYILP